MRAGAHAALLAIVTTLVAAGGAHAEDGAAAVQDAPPLADVWKSLVLDAREANYQVDESLVRVELRGGVQLRIADLLLYADAAVVWLEEAEGDDESESAGEAGEVGGKRYRRAEVYAEGAPVLLVRGLDGASVGLLPGDPRAEKQAIRQATGEWIFIDLLTGAALVQSAAVRSLFRGGDREIPLQVRAERIRMTPSQEILANDPFVTTCEFGDPHWRFHPREVVVSEGSRPGTRRIEARSSTLEIGSTPLLYLPYIAGEVGRGGLGRRIPLQRVRSGSTSALGAFLQTDWGGELGENVEWQVEADGYTKRGFGGGADLVWELLGGRGLVDTYIIDDQGEDDRFGERERDLRGRVHAAHRQPLTDSLRLDLELSYLSDRSFLDEYFETEAKTGKEQESLAYLRWLEGDMRGWALGKTRVNEWETTVEYLPQLGLDVAETPIAGGRLYYDSTSEVANVRRRWDNDLELKPQRTWRSDSTHVLGLPLQLGDVGLDLWGGVRHSEWEFLPDTDRGVRGDGSGRTSGLAGARAAINFSRIFEVEVPALDIHRLRHVITPTASYLGVFGVDTEPHETFAFDAVDLHEDVQLVRVGVLNRLQTQVPISPWREEGGETDGRFRGRPEEVLYLDVEALLFPDAERDNDGDVFGGVESEVIWRIREELALLAEATVLGGDHPALDELSFGLDWGASLGESRDEEPVERRLDFYLGHRHRADLSSATSLDLEARLDARWGVRMFTQYDWHTDRLPDAQLYLRRFSHDFITSVGVEWDDGEGDFGAWLRFNLRDLDREGRTALGPTENVYHDLRDRDVHERNAPQLLRPAEGGGSTAAPGAARPSGEGLAPR